MNNGGGGFEELLKWILIIIAVCVVIVFVMAFGITGIFYAFIALLIGICLLGWLFGGWGGG